MIEGGIAWLDLFTQINFFRPRLSPFTPWAYVLLAVFNIFKTTTILRSSRANLSGPYLPMYGPHLWLFLFVAFPVKNCQWWHLSNVTKVNRQSRSSERDKKFNYKTPRGNKRVLASSCVLYFNNVQGNIKAVFPKMFDPNKIGRIKSFAWLGSLPKVVDFMKILNLKDLNIFTGKDDSLMHLHQ